MAKLELIEIKDSVDVIKQPFVYEATLKMNVFLWLMLVCTMFLPTSSFAWTSSAHAQDLSLDTISPTTLTVISRNHEYVELIHGRVVRITANYGIAANGESVPLDQATINFRVTSSSSERAPLNYSLGWTKWYRGVNQGVDRDSGSAAVVIPKDVIAQYAINQCNQEKQRMISSGNSAEVIFGVDRRLPLIVSLSGQWGHKVFQGDGVEMHSFPSTQKLSALEIVCAAETTFNVISATIQVSPHPVARTDGVCEITTQVGISSTLPNQEVSYRLAGRMGERSRSYRIRTNQNGNAIGNHKLIVENRAGHATGSLSVSGFQPKLFSSNVVDYSVSCPVGHGLTKVPSTKLPLGIPTDGKRKAPGITPLSGAAPREKPAATPANKPQAPIAAPPVAIPNKEFPKK